MMGAKDFDLSAYSKLDIALCKELSLASSILYIEGQNDINHGQISGRLVGTDKFWLRGAALGFEEAGESDFLLMDLQGAVLAGGRHRPPEWPIHTEVYKARPDVRAIVHTHAPNALIFSALGQPLLPLSHDACPFVGNLGLFDVTTNTILNVDHARQMVDVLGSASAVLLKNHGIVVAAGSVKEATVLALLLERACALQLKVPAGMQASGSPAEDIAAKNEFIYSDIAMRTYWQYYVRKLDRIRSGTQLPEPHL